MKWNPTSASQKSRIESASSEPENDAQSKKTNTRKITSLAEQLYVSEVQMIEHLSEHQQKFQDWRVYMEAVDDVSRSSTHQSW